MIRIARVAVHGDCRHSPVYYQTVIENGVAVLSRWGLGIVELWDGKVISRYVRVA